MENAGNKEGKERKRKRKRREERGVEGGGKGVRGEEGKPEISSGVVPKIPGRSEKIRRAIL